jgi:1-phosphofructokinase family hexose kinase
MITVVAPSPSLDVAYVVDELVLGEVHRPTSVHREAGGKALNAARAAASLGVRVAAIAALWGVTGEFVAQRLADAGIELRRVGGRQETRTCVSIATTHSEGAAAGRMTELYERATPLCAAEWRMILDLTRETIPQQPGWLAAAGSVPDGLGADALAELVESGRNAGLAVAIDSHGPVLGPAVDAGPALVKVNRSEAAALLGRHVEGDILESAEAIHDRSGGIVVVTDGLTGSVATDGRDRWRVASSEVTGSFPVGSGDSFLGGMLAALDDGEDLVAALRLGAGCATANALEPGAARFDPRAARSIAETLVVERAE